MIDYLINEMFFLKISLPSLPIVSGRAGITTVY